MKLDIVFVLLMLLRTLYQRQQILSRHIVSMATHQLNGAWRPQVDGGNDDKEVGVTLNDLPKSNVFTTHLPPDPEFPTPEKSFKSPREDLGPRTVRGALFTYVRPEGMKNPELLAVSHRAMKDIGLRESEEETQEFKDLVAGHKIFWDPESMKGIYPWAQCYGGMNNPRGPNMTGIDARFRMAIVCDICYAYLACAYR